MTYYHKFYIALKPHNLLQNGMFLLSTLDELSHPLSVLTLSCGPQ